MAGLWLISSLDASGKLLVTAGVPVLMVAWFRYMGHVLLMTAVVLPQRGRAVFRTQSLSRQLQRGVLMIGTTVLFFTLLGRAPLAEGTAMNFMAPLFLLALAPWLLREPNRLHRWIGVLAGFAGMLVVVRPSGNLDTVTALIGVAPALAFCFFQIATRRVAHDDPLTTNYYGGLVGAIALTLVLPLFWQTPQLAPWQWVLLCATGVIGFLSHWLQIAGFQRAPASLLAPYLYLQIVSATFFGWAVFGQLPDGLTATGIGIICVAGLGVALAEARRATRDAMCASPSRTSH